MTCDLGMIFEISTHDVGDFAGHFEGLGTRTAEGGTVGVT